VIGSLVYFLGLALAITVQSTSPKGSGLWTFVCLHPACCVYFWGEVLARFEIGNEGLTTTTMAVSIASDVRRPSRPRPFSCGFRVRLGYQCASGCAPSGLGCWVWVPEP